MAGIVLAQLAALLPLLVVGSEVRLLSPDLLSVYGGGVVDGERRLRIEAPLRPGSAVRLIILPPNASDADRAAAFAPDRALVGVVSADRADLLLTLPDGASLGFVAFVEAHGIALTLIGRP
jgi:hypothetical protein